MSLAHLQAAARLAREASQGRRTIELVVTEEGVVVRGWTNIDGREARAHLDASWRDIDASADLASSVVMFVDRELSAMEGRG